MDRKVAAVCGIVAVLGILSAVAGFAAEVTKVKPSEVRIEQFSCVYPSSPAVGLGIVAAVIAILNRIVTFIFVGCCCRTRGSTSTPPAFSHLFNMLSWIASVIGVILLLAGAALNNQQRGQKDGYDTLTCYVVKPGIFGAGAVFSLLSAIFGVVAYISISSAAKLTNSPVELPLPVATNVNIETQH